MKKLPLLFFTFLSVAICQAQYVGLNSSEIKQLKQWVNTDAVTGKLVNASIKKPKRH